MNQFPLILSIARTHLTSKLKQTATATLGVTFGIGAYIILVSFMTGLNGMLDDLILNQTPHIRLYNEIEPSAVQPVSLYDKVDNALNIVHSVRPKQTKLQIHNALPILKYLNENDQILGAIPRVKAQIFYISGTIELGGSLTGIDLREEARLYNFGDYLIKGTIQDFENTTNGILLGIGIADKMSLDLGDRIQVSTPQGSVNSLKIVGVFQSGIAELDNISSFSTIKTTQRILSQPNNYITDIHIKLKDIGNAIPLSRKLEKQFSVKALDINTANAQFETGTTIRNLITYAVSITLLIVTGFGIYNILNMLIYEKMNDIAILRATGFSGKDVQLIFLCQALVIGILGGFLGLILGLGVSLLIDATPFDTAALPTVTTYPVNHHYAFYLAGIVFAIVSTFFAGYLPSLKARRIDPVQIIRGQ